MFIYYGRDIDPTMFMAMIYIASVQANTSI